MGTDAKERVAVYEASLRLAAIVESSDDAIVSKNLEGIITSWNPAAERLFGYTAEEAIGRSIRMIIPAERQGEEDEVLRNIRGGNRIDHFETVRRRKDGSEVPISLTVSPIKDASGRVIGASKIARDISDRIAAEEAVARSMALKDQFMRLVSHELRTPISTVVGNALLLLRRGDVMATADRRLALEDIASEGEKLQKVIENLLLLTQLEGTKGLTLQTTQLADLLESHVSALKRRSPGRTVDVVVDPAAGVVDAEPTLIALAVENLLSNAEKYSPDDSVIHVGIARTPDGGTSLTVRDEGIGIPPDGLSELFTPFFRTESARKVASGMGLGLALSKRIVEAHGGRIWADPIAEGGTEFTMVLPAPQAPFGGGK